MSTGIISSRGGGRVKYRWDERIVGTCDAGDCDRWAVSLAYGLRTVRLVPVCRRHIDAYRVTADGGWWQAEDEFAGLRFARRSKFRWLAQWRILCDQRAAMRGRESRAQRRLRLKAKARP